MSVYYSVYAEANVDGKWYSLSPLFKTGKDDFKTDFDVELAPIVPQGIGIDSNGKFRRVIWNGTIYE